MKWVQVPYIAIDQMAWDSLVAWLGSDDKAKAYIQKTMGHHKIRVIVRQEQSYEV